jgi:cysteinyl-tRNA synthetase, unknown class
MNKRSATLIVSVIVGSTILWAQSNKNFQPQSFAYLLQADAKKRTRAEAIKLLTESKRDLIIIDYSFTSGRFEKWTKAELDKIRSGKKGRKIVSYISIGEAENYRSYWQPAWDRDRDGRVDKGSPVFLLAMNPNWPGNYLVKYWNADWQKIILRYVDEIILQGFDGIYLDIVDAFQRFEYLPHNNKTIEKRMNPETQRSYREDMVAWVVQLAKHARELKKGFLIIPQNGAQLLEYIDYRKTIDAIGIEDLFTEGNKKQPLDRIRLVLNLLEPMKEDKKSIVLTEYPTTKQFKAYAREEAKKNSLTLLINDRHLKNLGESDGKKSPEDQL